MTVKLLLNLELQEKYGEKIIFVGFGCPLIGDDLFKEMLVNKNITNNLFFVKNRADFFVDLFHYLSKYLYPNDQDCFVEDFLKDIMSYLEDELIEEFEKKILKFLQNEKNQLTKIVVPIYCKMQIF